MAEIKNSDLLDYVISHGKELVRPTSSITPTRFLLSVMDVCEGNPGYQLTAFEKTELEAVFSGYLPFGSEAYWNARRKLVELLEAGNQGYLEAIYMQKLLYMAKQSPDSAKTGTIYVKTVLELLFKEPDTAVRSCLRSDASPEKKPQEKQVGDTPFESKPTQQSSPVSGDPGVRSSGSDASSSGEQLLFPKRRIAELTARVKKLYEELAALVLGQDKALSVFTNGYFQSELTANTGENSERPRATFLFAGPPGVGKTHLAESAAKALGIPFQRFDMSEYCDKEASLEFIGSDKVYRGGKEGNVTGFVANNPKCILLFDEIEKAHLSIIHLFLQLLDAGRLRDSFTDKEVSFKNTIIIFTTNAGKQLYENSELNDFSGIARKVILKGLQKDVDPRTGVPYFPAAICSRFSSGNVVLFNHMTANNLREIARREILRHAEALTKATGIRFSIDEQVYSTLLFAEGGGADARAVRSRAKAFFDDELFELCRLLDARKVASSIEDLEEISIKVALPENDAEIRALFECREKPEILLVASQETANACRAAYGEADYLVVQTEQEAKSLLQKHDVRFALIDPSFGCRNGADYLNIEDTESTARDLFWYVRSNHGNLPIYLLQSGAALSNEEKTSFRRQSVRGFLSLSDEAAPFADTVQAAILRLHQQHGMESLAKANKLLTYETAQTVSRDGKCAEIRLFDFETAVAVDAEDEGNILSSVSKPDVSFDQVIGAEEAKKELNYFVEYLKNPKKYLGTGVAAPKGVLLYGPPGTGKTLLAKAMASASDVTFITAEGNQFLKQYIGQGPDLVHTLFRTARKYAPAVLFVDEIDVIAKARTGDDGTGYKPDDVLTAFLAEMDGFKQNNSRPVFVLAATNYDVEPGSPKSLDAAFLRRFDRRIFVDLPDRDGRTRFIRMRSAENSAFELSEDMIDNLAIRSTGMSLADLASVMELALRTAIRDGNLKVTDEIIEEAFETFSCGESKSWDASLLERTARHEAGHAFLYWHSGDTPSYLTIVARGDHGGYMQHDDKEGKALYTKAELLARIRTSLGGRAAEIVYYGDEDGISTGASGDLRNATRVARHLLCSYGMDSEFGMSHIDLNSAVSGELAGEVRSAVNKILAEQLQEAIRTIAANRRAIDALVAELLVKNHLSGPEISAILTSVSV